MVDFIKNIFSKKNAQVKVFSQEEFENNYELKSKGLERVLGEMHNTVGHAIIPFEIGGAVHMYYFPNHIEGTGFATMELLDPDGKGPLPNNIGTYELAAFTRHKINPSFNEFLMAGEDGPTAFNLIERKICMTFTCIGNYSKEAIINPGDTCQLPSEEGEQETYLIFDNYTPDGKQFMIGSKSHHLMLCLEIFRNESEFAQKHGGAVLIEKLKENGHYPYSDLDREPVA